MKKIALPALAGLTMLGLAACSEPADPVAEEEAMMEEPAMTDPAMTEPVVPGPSADTVDGDSMSIDENGLDATINDGGTTTTVDVDDNPSMSVESD